MKSSRSLDFTEEAEDDLRSLLAYPLAAWGERQRDAYADRLLAAMRELLTHPHLGSAGDDRAPGLRRRPVEHHDFVYRVDDRAVTIIRILHAKLDAARQCRGRRT